MIGKNMESIDITRVCLQTNDIMGSGLLALFKRLLCVQSSLAEISQSRGFITKAFRRAKLMKGASSLGFMILFCVNNSVNGEVYNPSYIIPNVVADGKADDRVAIQQAIDALPSTGGTIWLPGMCYIGSGGISGGFPYGLVITKNNVTLTGPGIRQAGLVSEISGIRLVIVAGNGLTNKTDPFAPTQWVTSTPVREFAGAQAENSITVSMVNASDAATFAPGDVVFLRSGNLVDSAQPREPDSELNCVDSVSDATVRLTFPTKKPYVQERFISGTAGFTAVNGGGGLAPFGMVKCPVISNTKFKDINIHANSKSAQSAIFLHQAWGVTIDNCGVRFGKYGISARYARNVNITESSLYTLGASLDNDPAWLAPSTGCSDWNVTDCQGSGDFPAKLHSHEGVSDLSYTRWVSVTPDGPGQTGASNVSVRQRAYRHIYDIDMTGAYTETGCDMVLITKVDQPRGYVDFTRMRLRGAPGRYHLDVRSPAVTILQCAMNIGPGSPQIFVENGLNPYR